MKFTKQQKQAKGLINCFTYMVVFYLCIAASTAFGQINFVEDNTITVTPDSGRANYICSADFDNDGDVDGSDLASFVSDPFDESDLAAFAADFGRADCLISH